MKSKSRPSLLLILGPGILVAATGVGAGDLITAAFAGKFLGPAVLWAVLLGAFLKFILNEGIAQFQLRQGETFLAAALRDLGRICQLVFGLYLIFWTFFVGVALMSACGVAAAGLIGRQDSKMVTVVAAVLASLIGHTVIRRGGFAAFEKIMSASILLMFVIVTGTAIALCRQVDGIVSGLLIPSIPKLLDTGASGLHWTASLLGGVGGTLTILCYGYWIREAERDGVKDIPACRLDLAVGYCVTAIFGIAMVIIGSAVTLEGSGSALLVRLAETLAAELGAWVRPVFLVGALAAVFSSLLGVWQSVPLIFRDWWQTLPQRPALNFINRDPAQFWLRVMTVLPACFLGHDLKTVQKAYGMFGSLFVPLLALGLLILGRRAGLGRWSLLGLGFAIVVFCYLYVIEITGS